MTRDLKEGRLEERLRTALHEMGAIALSDDPGMSQPGSRRQGGAPNHSKWLWPVTAAAAVLIILGVVTTAVGSLGWDEAGLNEGGAAADGTSTAPASPRVSSSSVAATASQLTAFANEPGYAKVEIDYDAGMVQVLWKGDVPDEVRALEGTRPNGVIVVIAGAPYSEAELVEVCKRLLRAGPQNLDGARVTVCGPNPARNGLAVQVLQPWAGSATTLESFAQMPVEVELVDHPVEGGPARVN